MRVRSLCMENRIDNLLHHTRTKLEPAVAGLVHVALMWAIVDLQRQQALLQRMRIVLTDGNLEPPKCLTNYSGSLAECRMQPV